MCHFSPPRVYNVNLYYFARGLGKPTSNVLFWAVTAVNCPEEVPGVRLAVGSNAGSVWWVNGKEVIGIYGDRQTVIDDGVSKRLTLKKGRNIVRCAETLCAVPSSTAVGIPIFARGFSIPTKGRSRGSR